jgi:hypothetical protein
MNEKNTPRFELGSVYATPGALAAFADNPDADNPCDFLRRHHCGDWGTVDAEDQQENEAALIYGLRLLSSYVLSDGTKIWIITEADRSRTTILLPDEY